MTKMDSNPQFQYSTVRRWCIDLCYLLRSCSIISIIFRSSPLCLPCTQFPPFWTFFVVVWLATFCATRSAISCLHTVIYLSSVVPLIFRPMLTALPMLFLMPIWPHHISRLTYIWSTCIIIFPFIVVSWLCFVFQKGKVFTHTARSSFQ